MKVIRYHTVDGVFTGLLVREGPKFLHAVVMDSAGIRIRKIKRAEEERYIKELDYPIEKAKAHFRDAAKKFNTETSQELTLLLEEAPNERDN